MREDQVFANLAVRVPPEIMRELRQIKAITGRSVNQIVIDMLREGINSRAGAAV